MAKDYVLFLHGVNVRESLANEQRQIYTYADRLFKLISDTVRQQDPTRDCVKIPLYWGNVNRSVLNELLSSLQESSTWHRLWFKNFRKQNLLQFVGDGGLYISRLIGAMAAEQLKTQAFDGLKDCNPQDRIHLVTHSWGTVILFDILFASRWDDEKIPGSESVKAIRDRIYGMGTDPTQGIRLASIQTMGSPIALFSLITISGRNTNNESTHDISPGLEFLLSNLTQGNKKLPWLNFIHPGDPVAWPLEKVIVELIAGSSRSVQVQDVLVRGAGFWEFIAQSPLIRQTFLALVNGGNAHGSYWQSQDVARRIAENILKN
jgi:hypothetical protein